MKSIQIVSVILGTLLVVSACSGGGRGRAIGAQCPSSYNPVKMDVEAPKKVALDQDLPPGEYKYAGAEFYFINAQTDMRVSIRDVETFNGAFEARRNCVRNSKVGMSDFAVNTLGLSAMKVEANKKITTFDAKRIGFKLEAGKIVPESIALTAEDKPSSPKEVYDEGAAGERFLFEVSENNWEVRSVGVIEGNPYQLVVRFTRTDLPKATDEKPATEEKPVEETPGKETPVTTETPAPGGK